MPTTDQPRRKYHELQWTWKSMKQRCYSKTNKNFKNYGARGIKVHQTWMRLADFVQAIESEIGRRPSPAHTIDRIDSDGNYEPGNVRWATQAQQLRNQRRNRFIEHDGTRLCVTDWAAKTGIPKCVLRSRIDVLGWSVEKAVTTPVRRAYRAARSI